MREATVRGLESELPTKEEFEALLAEMWSEIEPRLIEGAVTPNLVVERLIDSEARAPFYWKMVTSAHDHRPNSPLVAQSNPISFARRSMRALSAIYMAKQRAGSAEQRARQALAARHTVFEEVYGIYLSKLSLLLPLSKEQLPVPDGTPGVLCSTLGALADSTSVVDPHANKWRNAYAHGHVEHMGRGRLRVWNVRDGKVTWSDDATTAEILGEAQRMMSAAFGLHRAVQAFVVRSSFEIMTPVLPKLGGVLRGDLTPSELDELNAAYIARVRAVYDDDLLTLCRAYFGRGESNLDREAA